MKALSSILVLVPGAALAHDSLVPHTHPHGASVLPDVTTFIIGGVLVACFYIAVRWFSKKS